MFNYIVSKGMELTTKYVLPEVIELPIEKEENKSLRPQISKQKLEGDDEQQESWISPISLIRTVIEILVVAVLYTNQQLSILQKAYALGVTTWHLIIEYINETTLHYIGVLSWYFSTSLLRQ